MQKHPPTVQTQLKKLNTTLQRDSPKIETFSKFGGFGSGFLCFIGDFRLCLEGCQIHPESSVPPSPQLHTSLISFSLCKPRSSHREVVFRSWHAAQVREDLEAVAGRERLKMPNAATRHPSGSPRCHCPRRYPLSPSVTGRQPQKTPEMTKLEM